jgi:hypothetical protein
MKEIGRSWALLLEDEKRRFIEASRRGNLSDLNS